MHSNDVRLGNIPEVSVTEAVSKLSGMYSGFIRKSIDLSNVPSVMLWGPPGIGKSQAVFQIADRLASDTGMKVKVTDIRLLLYNPVDLRGIPTADKDRTNAVWLRPQIFDLDSSDDVVNILFLDEISAAPQSVQAAAYQITLDHKVGEHRLPENCIVIAAGNRVTDKSVAYKMPKALSNRMMHFEIGSSAEDWGKWAVSKGINEKITGFLSFRPDYLMCFDSSNDELAYPTPRSWEMASNILNTVSDDIDEVFTLLAGIIGSGTASEMRAWFRIYDRLPSAKDIFDGKNPDVPKGMDAMYALISAMTSYAKEHDDDLDGIRNAIIYVNDMPPDFSTVFVKNLMSLKDDYKLTLMQIPEFMSWIRTRGKLINGI